MTTSNLHIKLSNGIIVNCVAENYSAPEEAYIVERLIQPLLTFSDAEKELELLTEYCTINEMRVNASYRYIINLRTKAVHFFEENYDHKNKTFHAGADLTHRYLDHLEKLSDAENQTNKNTNKKRSRS